MDRASTRPSSASGVYLHVFRRHVRLLGSFAIKYVVACRQKDTNVDVAAIVSDEGGLENFFNHPILFQGIIESSIDNERLLKMICSFAEVMCELCNSVLYQPRH